MEIYYPNIFTKNKQVFNNLIKKYIENDGKNMYKHYEKNPDVKRSCYDDINYRIFLNGDNEPFTNSFKIYYEDDTYLNELNKRKKEDKIHKKYIRDENRSYPLKLKYIIKESIKKIHEINENIVINHISFFPINIVHHLLWYGIPVAIIYCSFKNYKFNVKLTMDVDCLPVIAIIHKLFDAEKNMEFDISPVDLFSNNKNYIAFKLLKEFFESKNGNEWIENLLNVHNNKLNLIFENTFVDTNKIELNKKNLSKYLKQCMKVYDNDYISILLGISNNDDERDRIMVLVVRKCDNMKYKYIFDPHVKEIYSIKQFKNDISFLNNDNIYNIIDGENDKLQFFCYNENNIKINDKTNIKKTLCGFMDNKEILYLLYVFGWSDYSLEFENNRENYEKLVEFVNSPNIYYD